MLSAGSIFGILGSAALGTGAGVVALMLSTAHPGQPSLNLDHSGTVVQAPAAAAAAAATTPTSAPSPGSD
jgi:hypothetical protein